MLFPMGEIPTATASTADAKSTTSIVGGASKCNAPAAAAPPVTAIQPAANAAASVARRFASASVAPAFSAERYTATTSIAATSTARPTNATRSPGEPLGNGSGSDMQCLLYRERTGAN